MVITLMIPMRLIYGLEDFITERHLNNMAKVMLASGLIVDMATSWSNSYPGTVPVYSRTL